MRNYSKLFCLVTLAILFLTSCCVFIGQNFASKNINSVHIPSKFNGIDGAPSSIEGMDLKRPMEITSARNDGLGILKFRKLKRSAICEKSICNKSSMGKLVVVPLVNFTHAVLKVNDRPKRQLADATDGSLKIQSIENKTLQTNASEALPVERKRISNFVTTHYITHNNPERAVISLLECINLLLDIEDKFKFRKRYLKLNRSKINFIRNNDSHYKLERQLIGNMTAEEKYRHYANKAKRCDTRVKRYKETYFMDVYIDIAESMASLSEYIINNPNKSEDDIIEAYFMTNDNWLTSKSTLSSQKK